MIDHKPWSACFLVLCVAAHAMNSPTAHGQVMVSPAFAKNSDLQASDSNDGKSVSMTLTAAAEPRPALRYLFWPAPEDRRSADAMPFFSRAVLMTSNVRPQSPRDYAEQLERLQGSIAQLDVQEAKDFLATYGSRALEEVERAENLMAIQHDLQLQELSAPELISTLLPEYQEMRTIGRLLNIRARLAARQGEWDAFVRDIRLMMRLSEVASHSNDFIVCRLVGFSIATLAMECVQEAIQQPGCPNLYWALASIPAERLFEIKEAIEFESLTTQRMAGSPLPEYPIGGAAAQRLIKDFAGDLDAVLTSNGGDTAKLVAGAYIVMAADSSRDFLSKNLAWKDRVADLSDAEAVLRATKLRIEELGDDTFKWNLLPAELADKYQPRDPFATQLPIDFPAATLYQALTPAMSACRQAELRVKQTRNLLATIEAIRLHVSQNGKLPNSLTDLNPVPAWGDAAARDAFQYSRQNATDMTLTRKSNSQADKNVYRISFSAENE